ncbi:MAG: cysteine desulfurase [Kineosporiaceae bacterium]|nr:cysteine desulfurase [Kineosporiaceae bacterium]
MSVYLDHAATTPMRPQAVAAMCEVMARVGNASSLHTSGRRMRRVVEEAREQLAAVLGAGPSEVIFTGGGTEADNLAVKGLFWSRRAADPRRTRVIASAVEHHAVLDPVEWLAEREGADVVWLAVDEFGRVDPEAVRAAILDGDHGPDGVALVSVMWANNEVGTVQPIAEIAAVAREYGVPVHTDAVQAVGSLPVSFAASGVDAMTVSGHKLGGPVGVGALLARRGLQLTPVLHGGGQERQIRSGTLDAAAITGMATAARLSAESLADGEALRLARLRDGLVEAVLAEVPDAVLRGAPIEPTAEGGYGRLPGNAHFTFAGCEGDSLLYLLDARGVECSTGSACQAGVPQPSHVLLAMGVPSVQSRGALRFTLGWNSTEDDVAALVGAIGPAVARARRAGLTGVVGNGATGASGASGANGATALNGAQGAPGVPGASGASTVHEAS